MEERIKLVNQLRDDFVKNPNNKWIWDGLIDFLNNEDYYIVKAAAKAIGTVFPQMSESEKKRVWEDLIELSKKQNNQLENIDTNDDSFSIGLYFFRGIGPSYALGSIFQHFPDKKGAWDDIDSLAKSDNIQLRRSAAYITGAAFPYIPDKEQAWIVIQESIGSLERIALVNQLRDDFAENSDKKQIWGVLIRFLVDNEYDVEKATARALGKVFPDLVEKKQAWYELIKLMDDAHLSVRRGAAYALGAIFPHFPDKKLAWDEIFKMAESDNIQLQRGAAYVIGVAFPHIPDKKQAWNILQMFIHSNDDILRMHSTTSFRYFSDMPDKKLAWEELQFALKDNYVKKNAAFVLGTAFPYVSDKEKAWNVLMQLANTAKIIEPKINVACLNREVSFFAIYSLGAAYPYMPDKTQGWKDIFNLFGNVIEYNWSRDYGLKELIEAKDYSLGRACIFKATIAENEKDIESELSNAIGYFELASDISFDFFYPAKFCIPFYYAIISIMFDNSESEAVINNFLTKAKMACEGSENKEMLLKPLEELSNTLREVHKARNMEFKSKRYYLEKSRLDLESIEEQLIITQQIAPVETNLIRRGLSIINDRIKVILGDIQEKSEVISKQAKGTSVEEIANIVNQNVQAWRISDPEQMKRNMDNLIFSLKSRIPNNPINKDIYNKIEDINNEKDLVRQYELLPILIASIPQIVIEGNMTGDIYSNVHIEGTGIVVGSNNVVSINQQQLEKIPGEFAKSLQAFSDAVNAQLKRHNISQEKAAPVQESINELVKEVDIKPEEKIDIEKKEDIKDKIKKVAIRLLKILPEGAETVTTFTPLAPFSKIIGEGVEEIVKEFQK